MLEGLSVASQTDNRGAEPEILTCLAETRQAAGQFAEARATVAAGLAISAQLAQPFWVWLLKTANALKRLEF